MAFIVPRVTWTENKRRMMIMWYVLEQTKKRKIRKSKREQNSKCEKKIEWHNSLAQCVCVCFASKSVQEKAIFFLLVWPLVCGRILFSFKINRKIWSRRPLTRQANFIFNVKQTKWFTSMVLHPKNYTFNHYFIINQKGKNQITANIIKQIVDESWFINFYLDYGQV